jgi:serine/threonine protein kinase
VCSSDPKQLVFTSNQGKVVKGVLSGEFDVGFIRTDQIERSKDADGNAIDPKLFRIIDPKQNLTIDGEPFPFTSSTALYPEWNIAALSHVAEDVSRELQTAMIALAEHAKVGAALLKCREQNINDASVICQDIVFSDDFQGNYTARCDTTPEVADIALDAMRKGKYAAWQTTLSYMQLRSMQEATGFISEDSDTGVWRCIRSAEIYDSISCPSGYYRKSREDVNVGCSRQALECGEGYQCLCSPCAPIKVCVDAVEFNGKCVAYSVFLPSLLVPFFVVSAILVYCYVEYKRKQSDSVWAVKTSQLKFDDPPKIVGIGTFGLVLLAEYRGTAVAVKRVIPASNKGSKEGKSWFDQTSTQSLGDTDRGEGDIENLGLKSMSPAMIVRALKYGPLTNSVGDRQQKNRLLKADFVREMRHLSKLRHPCITTVMGAVISRVEEPMLVMEYMNLGSLHDVLHNESIGLDIGEHILPILQDVAQGMRFLHAASPHQVVHGDLKAKNVLIDSNYRAKVTDFGLSSAKKRIEASGTPFWMAPELLRGESLNTSKSDMYAFGILIYEAYSRKTPYGGEEPDEVLKAIMHPAMNKRPPVPPNCSERMAEMMKECLVLNPNSRPTSEQVDLSLRVEGGVKERTTRLEELNRELAEANKKIASASAMQLVSTVP